MDTLWWQCAKKVCIMIAKHIDPKPIIDLKKKYGEANCSDRVTMMAKSKEILFMLLYYHIILRYVITVRGKMSPVHM